MSSQIESAKQVLERFLSEKAQGTACVDREQVVAHAFLSGLSAHWPSRSGSEMRELLSSTQEIKFAERSRWMTQRRIAIAKLARAFG
jgi:hypothetical protein